MQTPVLERSVLTIAGSEGSAVTFAACCRPVPGDNIMGYLSAGKGVVVHRTNCGNASELRKHPDRCLDVQWAPLTQGIFRVALRLVAKNIPGVLANVSGSINEAGSNIEKVEQPDSNPETATLLFTISVHDRDHMATVLRRLRRKGRQHRAEPRHQPVAAATPRRRSHRPRLPR